MASLKRLLDRGLADTDAQWPPIRKAFNWVHQAAHILGNDAEREGEYVRRRLRGLVASMARWKDQVGSLEPAIGHFLKVTRSYWSGLFHCYDVPGLPRTNNDLEHLFGSHRHHERRATGRKGASPALVLRGSVCVIAAMATRSRTYAAREIAPRKIAQWRQLRQSLDERRHTRCLQRRFRIASDAYLANLEEQAVKLVLPA